MTGIFIMITGGWISEILYQLIGSVLSTIRLVQDFAGPSMVGDSN
jgi:hypothetical protein